MPSCPVCNEANPLTARFCSACGAELEPGSTADDAAPPERSTTHGESSAEAQLLALLRDGKKIEAIKRHREQTSCGLREAKEYVEALARRHNIEVKAGCAGMLLLACLAAAACVLLAISIR